MNQFNVSLWGDEAFSAVLSMKSVPEIIKIIINDTSPPLFNLTEHFWFKAAGTSEVAIRSLVFVYFLVAVFFVFKIGSYLWDRKTGLLAAVLTFLNPFFFIYAFEGRMYSILAATVTASMYFFVKRNWVGYVIATTLALYSHHFAIFALFVQGIWFLKEYFFGKRKVAVSIFKSFIAILILYSPWLLPLYNQTKMVGGGFWLGTPTLIDLRNLIYKYLAEGIDHKFSQLALILVFITLIVRRWAKDFEKTFFLLSWFLGPILLTWLVSQRFQSIFFDRYLLYTIPAGMLIVASLGRKYTGIVIAILLPILFIIDFHYYTHPTKRPFRELAAYVKEFKRGDDILINWNSSLHHLWESKYYGIPAPLYVPEGAALPFYVGTALMSESDIISSLPKRLPTKNVKVPTIAVGRVGVITSGEIDEIDLADYTKGEAVQFGDLKFVWFERSP